MHAGPGFSSSEARIMIKEEIELKCMQQNGWGAYFAACSHVKKKATWVCRIVAGQQQSTSRTIYIYV